jgi:AAA+ ATPase superfamily predicted ATPase
METNPFSHSGIVTGEAFCNREKELSDLAYLAAHSQNALLFSHRRMGKTSLIYQLMQTLKKKRPGIESVYIDLYGSVDEKDFIEAVFTGLAQIESKIEKLIKLASGLRFGGSVDPLSGQPSLSVTISPHDHPRYLETAMNALSAYSQKRKLLVIFDEFQEIDTYAEKSEKGFEKRLRSHIQGHTNIAYLFSGSQKHILTQMFNASDRAFYQMATSYPLKPIAVEHYIKWASAIFLRNRKTDLPDAIIREIVERCDFQPMYIQQFLFELWRFETIGAETIGQIELEILKNRENEFIILWDSLTVNQRKALRLLAETGGENMYYANVLQKFGLKSGSLLKRALTSLLSREVITKNKTYHIQDAMFRKWIQHLSSG